MTQTTSTPQEGARESTALAVNLDRAAKLTALSRTTLERAIREGRLTASRPSPRRVVIRMDDLDTFLTNSKEN